MLYRKDAQRTEEMTAQQADALLVTNAWIDSAVVDSLNKCDRFRGQFIGGRAAESSALDVTALVLTSLASVFTPANTVRPLAAAATGVLGIRAALDTDVYQEITALAYLQRVNDTYDKEIAGLLDHRPLTASEGFAREAVFIRSVLLTGRC
jgi:hypothetical protein